MWRIITRAAYSVWAVLLLVSILLPQYGQANKSTGNVVKVGYYQNENFQEGAADGEPKSGYSYEYLQKIASLTGWRYKYVYGSWDDLFAAFQKGEIDLLAGLGYAEERKAIMNYPAYPMGYEGYYLFISNDNTEITLNPDTLNGKKIGTISGLLDTNLRKWLREKSVTAEVIVYRDVNDRDQALERGEIDAFIGEGASVSAKAKNKPLLKIDSVNMYLCVAKQRTDLLNELNIALSTIDTNEPYYLNMLSGKYFSNSAIGVHVSEPERKWLEVHNYTIRVGYVDNFLPYCGTDADGKAVGVMVDALTVGFSNLKTERPVTFDYKAYATSEEMIEDVHQHKLDVIFPISDNVNFCEENDMYPSSVVISSAMNFVYQGPLEDARKKPLTINRHNQIQTDYAKRYFPDREIVYLDSVDECLKAVKDGWSGGAILSGLRASVLLRAADYADLSYVELPNSTVKCFGVSNYHKGILPLINQALNTLQKNNTVSYSAKYLESAHDYSLTEFLKRNRLSLSLLALLLIGGAAAAFAIARIRYQKQKLYYDFAYKDALTGLYNRRSLDEELAKLEKKIPDDLICVSMDLNGLKTANDNFGHAAGDELIREAGRIIRENLGKYGMVYRAGGDEFFALLRADRSTFEKAKAQLDKSCAEWKGNFDFPIRISVGMAMKEDAPDRQLSSIYKLADQRMYEAKAEYYRVNHIERRKNR